MIARANEAARRRFGIDEAVRFFFRPYLYLNDEAIEAAGLDPAAVEQAVAEDLTGMEGIALAVPRSVLPTLADTPVLARIRRNTHASRSGDIYIAQEPYWFLYEKGPIAAMHGAPWRYDTCPALKLAGWAGALHSSRSRTSIISLRLSICPMGDSGLSWARGESGCFR